MMSVKEYASDVNLSVEKILKLCKELDIKVSNQDDMLDDDAIIVLDNEIANLSDDVEEVIVEEVEEDYLEEDLVETPVETNKKPNKKKKGKNVPNNK